MRCSSFAIMDVPGEAVGQLRLSIQNGGVNLVPGQPLDTAQIRAGKIGTLEARDPK
jgi:hypothetical protein